MCLALLLAGIFGMHALNCLGPAARDGVGIPGSAMMSSAVTAGADVAERTVTAAAHRVTQSRVALNFATPEGSSMPMAGMCLALLVVSIVGLSRLFGAARAPSLLWARPRLHSERVPRFHVAPPDLIRLSIQRC